ncbi:MAG TPA: PKD domain-containing protein [Longimicrobiales bacterium]
MLAGTVALRAAGHGGAAQGLRFEVGGVTVEAGPDGTAYLDTRALADGEHALRATATVAGAPAEDEVTVVVRNDLPASGEVGAKGGALRSEGGSVLTVLPGAFGGEAHVSVDDTTEDEILAAFGIDYSAMGVTFLGALEVDTGGATPALPLSVDLAGWAEAVQPGQQVVMFTIVPDADGDGQGELTFGANALATPSGSVVTSPPQPSEVYGFEGGAGIRLQQARTARPGELVTLAGRGFNPVSPLSNAARYGPREAPAAETLVYAVATGGSGGNPDQSITLAVPALAAGPRELRLHNLTTGFATEALTVTVAQPGSGAPQAWLDLVDQVASAAERLASAHPGLAERHAPWLAALRSATDPVLGPMAAASGLVSAANAATLAALDPGDLSAEERELVAHHALVLDAVAASDGVSSAVADAAADVATLLMVAAHASAVPAAAAIAPQQAGGPSCAGGPSSTSTITWGTPVTTGMGSAPSGGCGAGSATGGGGAGALRAASAAGRADPADLAFASLRRGTFGPVAGAIVMVLRPDGETVLAPFTAVTDRSGYFYIPFLPANEPFVVRAVDPVGSRVAEATGVSRGVNQVTPVQLVFEPHEQGPGAPTASFTIVPLPDDRFDGTVFYRFDASASTDDEGIARYVWDTGGLVGSVDWKPDVIRGYGRNGTYQVRLTVFDADGNFDSVTRELVVDDLPYDYWAVPPARISETAEGEAFGQGVEYGVSIADDGRLAVFSTASSLSPRDTNGEPDVYLKDLATGEVELVSTDADGDAAGGLEFPLMSPDGRFVAYDVETAVFVKDLVTGETRSFANPDGFPRHWLRALSDDGGTVAFEASTSGSSRGAYVGDVATGSVTRVDEPSWGIFHLVDLSGDGRYLAFVSSSDTVVAGDDNGRSDVFRLDRQTGTVELVSVAADGTRGDDESDAWSQAMSADGRFVTFYSESASWPGAADNDDPDGFSPVEDVWVKDMVTGELVMASTSASGVPADDDSVLPVISADGRYVAFGSYASNLAPDADPYDPCDFSLCPGGFSYVKDLQTGRVVNVTVGMGDTLPDDWDQIEPVISANGRYVAYYSWADNLVPDDGGGTYDYFWLENPLWEP